MKEPIEKNIIWNPRYKIEFNILLNFINIINIVNVIITIRSSKSSRHNIAEVDVTESALTEPYKQKDRQTDSNTPTTEVTEDRMKYKMQFQRSMTQNVNPTEHQTLHSREQFSIHEQQIHCKEHNKQQTHIRFIRLSIFCMCQRIE